MPNQQKDELHPRKVVPNDSWQKFSGRLIRIYRVPQKPERRGGCLGQRGGAGIRDKIHGGAAKGEETDSGEIKCDAGEVRKRYR
jgi:hypothetical protein